MMTAEHWKTTKARQLARESDRSSQAARLIKQYREAPLFKTDDEKEAARQAGYKRGLLAVRDGRKPAEESEMWDARQDGVAGLNSEELTLTGLEILTSMHVIYGRGPLPTINMTTGKFS